MWILKQTKIKIFWKEAAWYLGEGIAKCATLTSLDLNLWDNRIGENGAKSWGEEIAKCDTLTSLNLNPSFNNNGENGAKYLGKGIANCATFTSLKLTVRADRGNTIGQNGNRILK